MGATIYSDSKLQYYPTDRVTITQVGLALASYYKIKEDYEERINEIKKKNNLYKANEFLPLISKDNELNKGINFEIEGKVVADLFCGKGEWLNTFKEDVKTYTYNKNVLIGNELEENRYNEMITKYDIDYAFNKPFEELQLPKYIVDVMLFNPPYGEYNGTRNAKKYLQMIFDRQYMVSKGAMVLVLNETDMRDCKDLIARYLTDEIMFKVNEEEFQKFGQYVLIGLVKDKPLDINNIQGMADYKNRLNNIESLINYVIDDSVYFGDYYVFNYAYKLSSSVDTIHKEIENYKQEIVFGEKISGKDKAYRWLYDMTLVESLSDKTIDVPKPLKSGELANIISSGKINGEITLDNGEAKHIVVGGVKTVTSNEMKKVTNKKGEIEEKLVTTKTSVPYLNILINENGKAKIKQLGDE